MYKAAEERINQGLSPVARFILGLFAALSGLAMILTAPTADDGTQAAGYYGFGIFCLLIAVACVTKGWVRQFVGSVIGTVILAVCCWYLYTEIIGGPFWSGEISEPSVVNAMFAFLAFGVPGAAYAVKTRFGFRGRPS